MRARPNELIGAVVVVLAVGCGTGRQAQWETATGAAAAGGPAAPAATAGQGDRAAAAEAAWSKRGDRAQLEQAIGHWEAMVAANPNDGLSWARLARAYYVLADGHLRGLGPKSEAYLGAFEKGTAAGERGLAAISPAFKAKVVDDEKVEDAIKVVGKEGLDAMYWYAVNLGKWSRAKGLAALLGNKDRVKGVLERVIELDETFFYGAPHRYFGVYWSLLPIGRDLDKSRTHFERSLALAPNYAGTRVLMAEAYAVKQQDRALFTKLLDEVLAMSDQAIPELEPETRIEKDKARELKAKADDLFDRRRAIAGLGAAAAASLVGRRARAAGPEFTLKLATVAPEGTPWADQLAQYKAKVESESKGRLRIKPFMGGALGDENQTVGECRRGAIGMWGGTTGALATSVPEISVLELPFLFRNAEEADRVLDKVLFEDLKKRLADRGFVLVLWSENGFRSFGTKWGPIRAPSDLKGHKMRSQESLVHLETYRAFGALPQPIAVTEVLPALQTGVVDGFDNTPLYTFAASWHLAIKHFTLSEHVYQPGAVLISKKEYDKLPADLQRVLTADLGTITSEGRTAVREMSPLLVDNFAKAKIPVYRPSAAERESLAKATATVQDKYVKAVPSAKPLLAAIKKALGGR